MKKQLPQLVLFLFLMFCHSIECSVWDLVVQTCDESGAGTDASVYVKIYYSNHMQETFELSSPDDDFEQGTRGHFALRLAFDEPYKFGFYWWPSGTLGEEWCVDWAMLINSNMDTCIVENFNKWIGYYDEPPTYPDNKKEMPFAKCMSPAIPSSGSWTWNHLHDRSDFDPQAFDLPLTQLQHGCGCRH